MAILIEDITKNAIRENVPTIAQAQDTEFWLKLNPHFTITPEGSHDKLAPIPVNVTEEMLHYLVTDGYIQLDKVISTEFVAGLRSGVDNLRNAGINPSFVFVYDEFWIISRQLNRLLTPILGETYQQLPDFWCWYLDPHTQEAGWGPHRDRIHANPIFPDGMPKSVTVWIALTDATPLNGCIYMLPAHLDKDYFNFKTRETNVNAHGIRALPVDAGSLLMWNQRVVHWGGTSSTRTSEPRISMAIEYQRADVPPFNTPMLKTPEALLPFDVRLMLIAKQFTQYHHMYRVSDELAALAKSILE
ncbi:MAG: phytanoyl-CoA dioxygenase family protein [Gammaproteobacteria bacterium]|nr:phytanoyl-CoA dioxygenase family protein [Gammaproteobacteria bacterium]MDH5651466.1 phytanoyl-CoA dioxygenase family protein [Gammaproteobacteria bacterium]